MTKLGRCLAIYRASRGLSLRDMADDMDISFMTLRRIEQGRQPTAETLISLWIWFCEVDRGEIPSEIQKRRNK